MKKTDSQTEETIEKDCPPRAPTPWPDKRLPNRRYESFIEPPPPKKEDAKKGMKLKE